MKRSTASFSMRLTTKIITLTLIITVAAGLLPLVSTTVEAANYETPYILYDANIGKVYVANHEFHVISTSTNSTSAKTIGVLSYTNVSSQVNIKVFEVYYNTSLGQWAASLQNTSQTNSKGFILGTSTGYYGYNSLIGSISSARIYTNCAWNSTEKSAVSSYSNDLSSLPQGLTESVIREIINQQLNTTTQAGQTAQTIINNTTTQYNLYLSGDIDSATMQQNVKSNIDTLSDLTPGTLLDAMQINNGLTYNQTIQDQLLNTASGNVQSMINGYQNTINNAISNYQNGTTSQQDTVNIINQTITNLNNMIINGTAKTTADVNAVNAAINAANANLDSVTGYKDLSQEVSEKVQQSDKEELDYLEELEAETTSTIEQLAPSQNFTGGQTGDAQEVLELVWENEFVKRLLPMCAGFMVVCVVLGIRYKV